MSGGKWNYNQSSLGYEMFPGCDICYGLGDDGKQYERSRKLARRLDPMEDKQLSELVFDVLCLIYSADWYQSGDTSEDTYRKDVRYFKEKWLKPKQAKLVKNEIDAAIEGARDDLYVSFGLKNREDEYE